MLEEEEEEVENIFSYVLKFLTRYMTQKIVFDFC